MDDRQLEAYVQKRLTAWLAELVRAYHGSWETDIETGETVHEDYGNVIRVEYNVEDVHPRRLEANETLS